MKKEIISFGKYKILDITADSADDVQSVRDFDTSIFPVEGMSLDQFDAVKITVPSSAEAVNGMNDAGYSFGDRTIHVSISLPKADIAFDRLIRFEIENVDKADVSDDLKMRILEISKAGFETDRRFHVIPLTSDDVRETDERLAEAVLAHWIDNLNNLYICRYKDRVVGFLDLEEVDSKTVEIHLAAIDKTAVVPGIAMSLYANAVKTAKESGYRKLVGRISSLNMPVINLYASLGAAFSDPLDVYIRRMT